MLFASQHNRLFNEQLNRKDRKRGNVHCNIPCLLLTDSFKDAGGICKGLLEDSERDVAMLEMRRNLPKPEMFNLHSVISPA